MSKKVLVIAAHPDDEVLGCGGAIALHKLSGDEVYTIIMCEGESVRYNDKGFQSDYTNEAAKVLGVNKSYVFNEPDQRLDSKALLDVIEPLEQLIEEIQPNIVYTQFGGDSNQDHKQLFDAALIATRPVFAFIEAIYAFYTVSSTEWGYPRSFIPDTWIDITKVIDKKIEAFECYKSEIKEYPHPRSSQALRNVAGFFGNQCLMEYAEAFMTIRRVIRL